MKSKKQKFTLDNSDIASTPSMSRRSALAKIGIGAGTAVATAIGLSTATRAADSALCDADPSDGWGQGRRGRRGTRHCDRD